MLLQDMQSFTLIILSFLVAPLSLIDSITGESVWPSLVQVTGVVLEHQKKEITV